MNKILGMVITAWLAFAGWPHVGAVELKLSTFDVDATPELSSPLAYDPLREVTEPLSCRGIVLQPSADKPIVLCAVDWLGVANAAHDKFCAQLADCVDTTVDRVVVHALHQHDAPRCDLSAAQVLEEVGIAAQHYDVPFIEQCIVRAGQAARKSLDSAQSVHSIRFGKSKVARVASNRRMLGPNGKVHTTRYTACRDPKIRALPEGVIDPWLQSLAFDGSDGRLAVLTFYATHPQSYYRTGQANPDFPGMARNQRQQETGVFHLHFNGAGGNLGAGKYNDGSHENRPLLANRLASGMQRAWESMHEPARNEQEKSEPSRTVKDPPLPELQWNVESVVLPVGEHLQKADLRRTLLDESTPAAIRLNTAKKLAFLHRFESKKPIRISHLKIGKEHLLFLPGELFVEYQLAAQAMLPDDSVMVAAYGDYGPGYIGTKVAYPQGGYEVSERASNVSPNVEQILVGAMKKLLNSKVEVWASDFTDRTGPLPK